MLENTERTNNENTFNPYKQMMRNMPKFKTYPPNIPAAVNATDEFLFGWWRFLPSPADEREEKILRAIVQEVKGRHLYNDSPSYSQSHYSSRSRNYTPQTRAPRQQGDYNPNYRNNNNNYDNRNDNRNH